ncbi:breast carcinoma-amplified sequence 4 isoform X1 [Marmota flaviventris]|uniref:breast carcinoma-amplified sequence 4 isoform X1 n=1 Tax=Marmota flaviventris TaxID=93162 RepID=UPI003A85F8B6
MLLVDADSPEPVRSGAHELALFLTPEPGAEARAVEAAIEGLLVALEDLSLATCRFLFQIRSDTSQILEENVPVLKAKVTEMRGIYAKVDRLEAFVRMVGHHAALLEAHVRQAERDHGAFPQALWRWLGSAGFPSFRNAPPGPGPPASELPALYRTEDYVPVDAPEAEHQSR